MKLLLDTHVLLWAGSLTGRLKSAARRLLNDPENDLVFSAASLWELVVKNAIGRDTFRLDVRAFRRTLVDNGYTELQITCEHALAVGSLPPIHRDPFDRLLVAQAIVEGITLVTADPVLAKYPAPVHRI